MNDQSETQTGMSDCKVQVLPTVNREILWFHMSNPGSRSPQTIQLPETGTLNNDPDFVTPAESERVKLGEWTHSKITPSNTLKSKILRLVKSYHNCVKREGLTSQQRLVSFPQTYGTASHATKLLNKVILASYFSESSMHEAVIFLTLLANMIQFCLRKKLTLRNPIAKQQSLLDCASSAKGPATAE